MDPLSLTASIITIIGVGGEAAKAVRKLASLNGAPSLVLALNNEMSDLYLVVLAIRDVYQRQRASTALSPNHASTDDTITSTLLQANDKVLELRALHQRLTSWATGSGGLSTLNKASWLREQKNVKKMQEDLRTVRLKLSTALGILNSSSLLHLETGVQALHTKLEDVRIHQQRGRLVQDQNSARTERAVEEPIAQLLSGQQRIELKLNADTAQGIMHTIESQMPAPTHSRDRESVSPPAICVTAFTSYNRCIGGCVCKCHHLQARRSPQALNRLLGRLFFGYAGLPYLGPLCDSKSCDRNSYPMISIIYFFPVWLLARALTMVARLSSITGPEINIRFPRITATSSRLFNLARQGKVDDIRLLLQQGHASPFDIDSSNGYTALMYALESGHVETCKTLLYASADPCHENNYSHNCCDLVWILLLNNSFDLETRGQLQTLFSDQGFLEGLQLTLLHKTVLGLNQLDLASLVSSLPRSAIDEVDSGGRTPLFWAARRGDSPKVSLLIEKGADVTKLSLNGYTPLDAAIYSQDQACIRDILNLVSDVNCKDCQGWTPLLSCCYYGIHTNIVDLLISRGADIESTVEDGTALILTAQVNYRQCGEVLIARGAELNTIADNGETALLHAISLNSHEMIHLLLQHHADHCIKTPLGESLLHYAAQYSDLGSLGILCAADLRGLKIEDRAKGYTALEMADRRRQVPPEWLPKFQELIASVVHSNQNTHANTASAPSDVEDFEDALEHQD